MCAMCFFWIRRRSLHLHKRPNEPAKTTAFSACVIAASVGISAYEFPCVWCAVFSFKTKGPQSAASHRIASPGHLVDTNSPFASALISSVPRDQIFRVYFFLWLSSLRWWSIDWYHQWLHLSFVLFWQRRCGVGTLTTISQRSYHMIWVFEKQLCRGNASWTVVCRRGTNGVKVKSKQRRSKNWQTFRHVRTWTGQLLNDQLDKNRL